MLRAAQQGLLGPFACVRACAISTSACQHTSSLEKFIAGEYDPLAKKKQQEEAKERERGQRGRPARDGSLAQRLTREGRDRPFSRGDRREWVERGERREGPDRGERRDGPDRGERRPRVEGGERGERRPAGGGRMAQSMAVDSVRRRARPGRDERTPGTRTDAPRGARPRPTTGVEVADDAEEEEGEAGETPRRRRPPRRPAGADPEGPRKRPSSMLSTISDDSATVPGRRRRTSAQQARPGGAERVPGGGAQRTKGRRRRGADDDEEDEEKEEDDDDEEEGRQGRRRRQREQADEEPDWHVVTPTDAATLPLTKDGLHYSLDEDGTSIYDEWDQMGVLELRKLLAEEIAYTPADHEEWLRGEGQAIIREQFKEWVGRDYRDEEEWEQEILCQKMLYYKYQWPDRLYFYIKAREAELGVKAVDLVNPDDLFERIAEQEEELEEAQQAAAEAEAGGEQQAAQAEGDDRVAGEKQVPGSEAAMAAAAPDGGDDGVAGASVGAMQTAAEAESSLEGSMEGGQAEREVQMQQQVDAVDGVQRQQGGHEGVLETEQEEESLEEDSLEAEGLDEDEEDLEEEEAPVDEEFKKEWDELMVKVDEQAEQQQGLADTLRLKMREQRMLKLFRAIRERSRIGAAPRRHGAAFNQQEYDYARVETMMDVLDPSRFRAHDGSMLSDKMADDARRLHLIGWHPEFKVHTSRPRLFMPTTEEQVSEEFIDRNLEQQRRDICHPLEGIYDEEDWQEYKHEFKKNATSVLAARTAELHEAGYSGLMGGYEEEQAFLHSLADSMMPESDPGRDYVRSLTDRIAKNHQWTWAYKCKAVRLAARTVHKLGQKQKKGGLGGLSFSQA